MMKITSLEQMETIVGKNKSLRWDGWTVVNSYQSNNGWLKPNGAYRNGKWYLETRFEAGAEGWDIPSKFVR